MSTKTKTETVDTVEHTDIYEALAAFQAELPEVRAEAEGRAEEADGSTRTYKYAGLADISQITLRALGRHGLSFTAVISGGGHSIPFGLEYKLTHASGDSIRGRFPLPDPLETAPAEFGLRIAAARRHALTAATGVAPGGHDEHEAAIQAARKAEPEPVDDVPVRDWIAEAGNLDTREQVQVLWLEMRDEVKAGRASQEALDAVAEIARQTRYSDD